LISLKNFPTSAAVCRAHGRRPLLQDGTLHPPEPPLQGAHCCSIVSDQDPIFTSNLWKELFALSGVQLRLSSVFPPQTDGQSEVVN
jgi:hypothetical protein